MVPLRIETILISAQHDQDVTNEQIKKDIIKYVIQPVIPKEMLDENTKYFIKFMQNAFKMFICHK